MRAKFRDAQGLKLPLKLENLLRELPIKRKGFWSFFKEEVYVKYRTFNRLFYSGFPTDGFFTIQVCDAFSYFSSDILRCGEGKFEIDNDWKEKLFSFRENLFFLVSNSQPITEAYWGGLVSLPKLIIPRKLYVGVPLPPK